MQDFSKIILFLLLPVFSLAQQSDMVVLKKKNNRTVQTYFAGMEVNFQNTDGKWITGKINHIQKDSLFISYYDTRLIPNQIGGYTRETIALLPYQIHYLDIIAIPKKHNSLRFLKKGTILKLGGAGYILLNLFNGQFLDESITSNKNLKNLSIAGGVMVTGFLMGKLHKDIIKVGSRYNLKYVKLTD